MSIPYCYLLRASRLRWLLLMILLVSLALAGCSSANNTSSSPASPGNRPQGSNRTARLVYAADHSLLAALDGTSGAIIWRYQPGLSLNFISGISDATDRAIYVGISDGAHAHLVALRADTGRLLWSVATPYAVIPSGEASNGLLYAGGAALSAFQPATGRLVWLARPDTGRFSTQPFFSNTAIYIGGNDGLYAFDPMTGSRLWKNSSIPTLESLALADRLLYTAQSGRNILALDATSGKVLWQFRTDAKVQGDLQAANGLVYFSTANNFVNAIKEGTLAWRTPLPLPGTPGVTTSSNLYVTGNASNHYLVYGLSWQSGKILWQSDFSTWKLSKYRPRIAGLVYTARNGVHDASDGYVVALDPATGRPVWQTQVDGGDDGDLTPVTAWCSIQCTQANQNYT